MKTKLLEFMKTFMVWTLVTGFSLGWGYSTTFAADATLTNLSISGGNSFYKNTSSNCSVISKFGDDLSQTGTSGARGEL